MVEETDEQLYAAWATGDRQRGGRLVERYLDPIRRFFAHKTMPDVDPDDLAARVFSSCNDALGHFRGEASFRSYLFGIAYNVLRESLRRRRPSEELDLEASALAELGPSPASVLSLARKRRLVMDALRSLPIATQVALELAYVEGLHRSEIAHCLAVPEGTVASRLRRGLAQLRERVHALEADPEARAEALRDFPDEL